MSDLDLLDLLAADHANLLEAGPLVVTFVSQHLSVERDLLYPLIRAYCRDGAEEVDRLRRAERLLEERLGAFEADPTTDPTTGPRAALDAAIREHIDDQATMFPRLRREIPTAALEGALGTVPLSIGGSPTHGHPHLAEGGVTGEAVEDVVSIVDHIRDRVGRRAAAEDSAARN